LLELFGVWHCRSHLEHAWCLTMPPCDCAEFYFGDSFKSASG
jgi:hypothetical protein